MSKSLVLEKEVWEVEVQDMEYTGVSTLTRLQPTEYKTYQVFADSACEAEEIGIELAEIDNMTAPVCISAKFLCYVREP